MEEAGQGDSPARGCQMCDPARHSATRATADSQLDASWNRRPVRVGEDNGGDMRHGKMGRNDR